MGKYGAAAVEAANLCRHGLAESPLDAWEQATARLFGLGTSSQCKGCPKGAFLGLCEEGLVEGVEPGHYTQSWDNKRYAVDAVAILRQRPWLSGNQSRLWAEVMAGETKKHNSQMDVVTALWNAGLIQAR